MSDTTDIRVVVRGGIVAAVYVTGTDDAFVEVLDMDNAEAEGPKVLASTEQIVESMDKKDSSWKAVY